MKCPNFAKRSVLMRSGRDDIEGRPPMSRGEVLRRYGITDRPEIRVNTVQEGNSPLWVVAINGPGDPIKALPSKRAAELSIALRQAREDDLAAQISTAAQKAQRANSGT
jgi:hypothetical protein